MPEEKSDKNFLFENYNKKIFKPSPYEVKINNSSRSAKLRFATRSNNRFFFPSSVFEKFNNYLEVESFNV